MSRRQIGVYGGNDMKLDGLGLLVNDMAGMIRFYRDVLGFEIKGAEDTENVYLVNELNIARFSE